MEVFFISVLNRSYQAALVICFILAVRLLFKLVRVPGKYTCMLWSIPFFKLICPFTIESVLSLLPAKEPLLPQDIGYMAEPKVATGNVYIDVFIGQALPAATPEASVNPMQVWLLVLRIIWLAGVAGCLLYGVVSYLCLKRKLRCSICLADNVFLTDHIGMPFVLGVLRPRIYLPSSLGIEEKEYVLAHERMHIRRGDHLCKLAAFLITGWHWFNPFVWAAYAMLGRDMEMACDEAVMKLCGEGCRKEYAKTLLDCAAGQRQRGVPLAFSEGSPKNRIRNILRYKKPLAGLSVVAVVAIVLLAAGLLSNPRPTEEKPGEDGAGTPAETTILPEEGSLPETATLPEEVTSPGETDGGWEEAVAATPPTLTADMPIGADNMILDYADGRTMIFHGYFGLFVCDTENHTITGAVDLKAIGCDATQGNDYCEVSVAKDGSKVYLAPLSGNMMYVYDVSAQSLVRKPHDMYGIEVFDAFVEQSAFLEEYVGFRSERRAVITGSDGSVRYGYLSSVEGIIGDICYEEISYVAKDQYRYRTYPVFAESELSSSLYAMTAVEVTDAGIVFSIFNNSRKELIFSEDFKLQRWENGEWTDVPYVVDNGAFKQPAYPVGAGDHREAENNWEWLYGKLPGGTYLFVKPILVETEEGDREEIPLGVSFVLPADAE